MTKKKYTPMQIEKVMSDLDEISKDTEKVPEMLDTAFSVIDYLQEEIIGLRRRNSFLEEVNEIMNKELKKGAEELKLKKDKEN